MHGTPENIAVSLLTEASECIGNRAEERDTEAERSMKATVDAFNAIYDKGLTEEHGWSLMILLKLCRARGGKAQKDNYIDAAAYAALAGECALSTREHSSREAN